jgi:uncharacterized hydrophobic protein (TIGR00271 family)
VYKNIYFISENPTHKSLDGVFDYIKEKYKINVSIYNINDIFEESTNTLFLLYLDDNNIKTFFQNHLNKNINIGILPNENCINAIRNYGLSKNLFEAIDDAFNPKLLSKIDLLKCNDHLAFNRISIGDMHGMNRLDYNEKNRCKKIKIFFNNLTNISFKSYTLKTSKNHSIQTAASGITILEHSIINEKSAISDDFSLHDGKLNAFVLAPTSLLSYIWYLLAIFFYRKISLVSLPKSLGFIKTAKLTITSFGLIDYSIDDKDLLKTKVIDLEVLQDCLNVHLGRSLIDNVKNDGKKIEEKDTIKLNTLPKGEVNNILIHGKLPLFKKASDDDIKELFVSLKDSARFSYIYLTLTILSTLLATTGLFANSAPVIIGAMILAPLMAPIISLSMGVIRADKYLLKHSSKTLIFGIFTGLSFSCIYTLFIPLDQITPEMQGRLNPNMLDLMVAVFSGIAGAYANAKEEVAKSLAGVAIAVALVPPLSVAGIGIGLLNYDVIYGSFLLFLTNLVGITLSAALTFMVLGYSPIKRAKKGLIYTSILMVIIAIPLMFSFIQMVEKHNYFKRLEDTKYMIIDNQKVDLEIININKYDNVVYIDLEVISTTTLSLDDYKKVKQEFKKKLGKDVVLKIIPKVIVY